MGHAPPKSRQQPAEELLSREGPLRGRLDERSPILAAEQTEEQEEEQPQEHADAQVTTGNGEARAPAINLGVPGEVTARRQDHGQCPDP